MFWKWRQLRNLWTLGISFSMVYSQVNEEINLHHQFPTSQSKLEIPKLANKVSEMNKKKIQRIIVMILKITALAGSSNGPIYHGCRTCWLFIANIFEWKYHGIAWIVSTGQRKTFCGDLYLWIENLKNIQKSCVLWKVTYDEINNIQELQLDQIFLNLEIILLGHKCIIV